MVYTPKPHKKRNQQFDFFNVQLKEIVNAFPKHKTAVPHIVDVLKQGNDQCVYCACAVRAHNIDEMIPITKYGNMTDLNRVPCCGSCNSSKGNRTDNEFEAWLHRKVPKQRAETIVRYVRVHRQLLILTPKQKTILLKRKHALQELWKNLEAQAEQLYDV